MLPKPPAFFFLSLSAIVLALVHPAPAQSSAADGFTVQERSGVALVKPQPWSKDSEAVVMEFFAFTDRTASGAAGAGYIEFQTKSSAKRQIPTARIVKMVVYPDPNLVKEVVTEKDRESLAAVAADLKGTVAKFPSTRTYIQSALEKVNDELAKYDAGKVKTNGEWIERGVYVADRARTFSTQIRPDILNAEPPSSFDLESDPRFIALKELAKTHASVKPLVTELSAMYGKRVRAEQRTALLTRLADPNLSLAEARTAVARLKGLQPEEDARAVLFLKNWDAGVAKAEAETAEAKTLSAALEKEMAAFQDDQTLPTLSPELDKKIAALNIAYSAFAATKPPAPLLAETVQVQAVCLMATGLARVKAAFDNRQYFEAKDVLDAMSGKAALVGPESSRVVANLLKVASSSISEFSRLREEGKVQADANKPAEALAAYEKAYEVIPDPSVGDQIAQLREKVPQKKK